MKHPSFLLVALVGVAACTRGDPLQPDGQALRVVPSEVSAAKATTVPFTAISVLAVPGLDIAKPTGKVLHVGGGVYVWDLTGDLTGIFVADGYWLVRQHGPTAATGHGSWSMELTAPCTGGFDGKWHGVYDPDFNGVLEGKGTGGCAGLQLKADFYPVTPGIWSVLHTVGTIHNPNP